MAYQKTVPTPTDASIILTYRHPHFHRGAEWQERRTARSCGRFRQGTSHTADIEGNGAEGYRFRLHGV